MNINISNYRKVFIGSDLHLHHDKAFLYEPRGCKTPNEHTKMVLDLINNNTKHDDCIILLGDFALTCEYDMMISDLCHMNCNTFMFIIGNHDNRIERMFKRMQESPTTWSLDEKELFNTKQLINLGKYAEVEFLTHPNGDISKKAIRQEATLCHFPMAIWNRCNRSAIMLCGHSHGNYVGTSISNIAGKILDVGVENALAYSGGKNVLFEYDHILDIMRYKKHLSVDHH